MEWVKNTGYDYDTTEYLGAPSPSTNDYANYSAVITAESVNIPDDGIQKITVTIKYSDQGVFTLEGYKVDR
jgi:hypothetical protein